MAFTIPTLTGLVERARQAFRNELPGSDAWVWPNNINVTAKVIAGMVHLLFLWLAYIAKQRWITTADGEFLDRHGVVYGMARLAPTYARGKVVFTGTPGIVLPAGIGVSINEHDYVTENPAEISGLGSVTLDVVADQPGAAGNAIAGTSVSLRSAVNGINSGGGLVHTAGIGLGADEEGDESYRARLLWRIRMPPHGGAAHDYVAWAREIGGVTRVFVDPLASGPGTVTVYFLMDDLYTNGIPQGADVDAVDEHIGVLRPATAQVTVLAPEPVEIDITIDNLVPDTTVVRDAIYLELQDLFQREGKVSTEANPFTMYRSKIWQAIANATGEDHHTLAEPATDVLLDTGQMPILGEITYT